MVRRGSRRTLIAFFGEKRVHWAIMFVAFIVGIPVFFQVGFVLLIPLVFTIARQTGTSLVKIGIPLVAGLSVVHGFVPPHPAAMLAVVAFKADVGLHDRCTRCWSDCRRRRWPGRSTAHGSLRGYSCRRTTRWPRSSGPSRRAPMPGFGITVFTVLLPVLLMLCASTAEVTLDADSPLRHALAFIGSPIVSLLVALLFSYFSLGQAQGFTRDQILKFCNDCLAPTATICW